MMRNTITWLILLMLVSSFTSRHKGADEYSQLLKLEHNALLSTVGKVYIVDLTGRKGCNKTRIKYLGVVHTKNGKSYKVLTSFFVFSSGATCHGTSRIKFCDMKNRYIGEYNVGMPESLPDVLTNNKLFYLRNSEDCNMRKTRYINLSRGIPKMIFIPCNEKGGEAFSFTSKK
jgi:hypothetical protein